MLPVNKCHMNFDDKSNFQATKRGFVSRVFPKSTLKVSQIKISMLKRPLKFQQIKNPFSDKAFTSYVFTAAKHRTIESQQRKTTNDARA